MHRLMHISYFNKSTKRSGFTLVEIMIVLVIISILASIALPSYASYVARARRADAKAQLLQVAQFMQSFYAANDSFLQDRAANAVLSQVPAALLQSPADALKIYGLVIPGTTLTDNSFEIRMAPVASGTMDTDQCGTFTLTSNGVRGVLLNGVKGDAALRDRCWR